VLDPINSLPDPSSPSPNRLGTTTFVRALSWITAAQEVAVLINHHSTQSCCFLEYVWPSRIPLVCAKSTPSQRRSSRVFGRTHAYASYPSSLALTHTMPIMLVPLVTSCEQATSYLLKEQCTATVSRGDPHRVRWCVSGTEALILAW